MKTITEKLKHRFPRLIIKDSNEFSNEYEIGTSLWLQNAQDVTYTKKDLNTIYNTSYGIKGYDIEVYEKFNKWCNKYGYYASTENYTLQLFKI